MSSASRLTMPTFMRGLVAQGEVVHALILRETRTRFGAHQLGYLWAVVEPLLLILTFYILFVVANRQLPEGMDAMSFVATGVIPYNLFSNSLNRVSQSIAGNRALLFYPQVRPIDLAIARSLLEVATYCAVFVVLMTAHGLYIQTFEIDSALKTVAGFMLAGVLGSTAGLVFCTLGQLSNAVDRIRGPIIRPLFWISGIFFAVSELPDRARDVMLYNPVLHVTELVRSGWFTSYESQYVDHSYVLGWCLVLAFVGLSLERVVRRRIELS
jgi:capsular polysaccharide transport system permease protein